MGHILLFPRPFTQFYLHPPDFAGRQRQPWAASILIPRLQSSACFSTCTPGVSHPAHRLTTAFSPHSAQPLTASLPCAIPSRNCPTQHPTLISPTLSTYSPTYKTHRTSPMTGRLPPSRCI